MEAMWNYVEPLLEACRRYVDAILGYLGPNMAYCRASGLTMGHFSAMLNPGLGQKRPKNIVKFGIFRASKLPC